MSGAFEWVDLESDIARSVPRFGPVKRIVSYHNLTETPPDLEAIYAYLRSIPPIRNRVPEPLPPAAETAQKQLAERK